MTAAEIARRHAELARQGRNPAFLRHVVVDEVSLVDAGANQFAHIVLFKSAEGSGAPGAMNAEVDPFAKTAELMAWAEGVARTTITKDGQPPLTEAQALAKLLATHPGEYEKAEQQRQALDYTPCWGET